MKNIQTFSQRDQVDKDFLKHVNQISLAESFDSNLDKSTINPFGNKKESLVRKAEEFKERNHVITGDVYSMTFASLIDNTVIQKNKQMQGDGFLPPIQMTEEETGRMFLGCLMVIGI